MRSATPAESCDDYVRSPRPSISQMLPAMSFAWPRDGFHTGIKRSSAFALERCQNTAEADLYV